MKPPSYALLSMAMAAFAWSVSLPACDDDMPPSRPGLINDAVQWPAFLARHDLMWSQLPRDYQASAFLGNGLMGATIYAQGRDDQRLTWHEGRSDVVFRGNRIAIGDLVLTMVGGRQSCEMRLDLWNAELTGAVRSERGAISFRSFIHADLMVQVIEIRPIEGVPEWSMEWKPGEAINPRIAKRKLPMTEEDRNPLPVMTMAGNTRTCLQSLNTGGQVATVWCEVPDDHGGRTYFLSVGFSPDRHQAEADALGAVEKASSLGVARLVSTHRDWWYGYYPGSFLSIPDTRLESFYWIQIYKLGSATRKGRPPMDLMGPWFRGTPWPKIWWNLNEQLQYWPIYAGNHLDLGEPLVEMLGRNIGNLAANAGVFSHDSATIATATSYDCVGRGDELCNLPWACHNFWLQYRYGMDEGMLREKLFPLLRRSVNYYLHHLAEGADGRLHVTIGSSPEYPLQPKPNPDCNIDLALLQWGCRTLLYIAGRLAPDDPLIPQWEKVLHALAPCPTDANGLMVSAGVPFAESHRHYSHLFMFYPLHLLDWERSDDRALISRSFAHWTGMTSAWKGYSMTGAASMCASMGRGDDALSYLHMMLNKVDMPSTLYTSSGPCLEVPLSAAASLQEMLLQSWGTFVASGSRHADDYVAPIRIFPAVPSTWKEVVIHDMRAEGAFLVSAVRIDGRTQWERVKSLAGTPCRIRTSLIGDVKATRPMRSLGEGLWLVDLDKDEEVTLYTGGTVPICSIIPVPEDREQCRSYGLPSGR